MNKNYSEHMLPAPRPGWEWIIGRVGSDDMFQRYDGKMIQSEAHYPRNQTDGPTVWHNDGELTFRIAGYIRRKTK